MTTSTTTLSQRCHNVAVPAGQRPLQLEKDKDKEKIADEKVANRRIALMNERKKRVLVEPNFGEDITFSMVIHIKIPIHLRKFMIG